jgi:hypothetical protein
MGPLLLERSSLCDAVLTVPRKFLRDGPLTPLVHAAPPSPFVLAHQDVSERLDAEGDEVAPLNWW